MDKDAMEIVLSEAVHILYWEAGAEHHECIQVTCATLPYLALSRCASSVQMLLGVYDDAGTLIETYDPAQARWVTHAAWLPRDLSACPYVLCRERYPWGLADDVPEDMDAEVEAMLERVRDTRKRRRSSPSIDERPTVPPSQRQTAPLPRIIAPANVHPAVQPRDAFELQTPAALALMPSSAHIRWPLKYVAAMAAGFHRMHMGRAPAGTRRAQFAAAFQVPFPPISTYHDNAGVWNAAPEALKAKYVLAGYSEAGLWKNFRREVRARCAEGKVSGGRGRMVNGDGRVKTEVAEVQ